MIDKQEFYHGAALIRLLADNRCIRVCGRDFGYEVNDKVFIHFKYSTKVRSPWGFTFNDDEISKLDKMKETHERIMVALICDGDGICALDWYTIFELLGAKSGRLAIKRDFNKQYTIWGAADCLNHKVSNKEWPEGLFK